MSDRQYKLTPEQLASFRENGFIGPVDLYDEDFIKEKYREIRADIFDRSNTAYDLPHNSLLAGYDRHLDVEFFTKHVSQPRIVHKVQDILGPDLLCWRSEMFPKYPGDEGTDWHQADTFSHASGAPQIVWPGDSGFGGAITVWTALTDVTEENGCLRFIPGTHEEMFYDETKEMKYTPEMVNSLEKDGIKRGFFGYDYRNLQKDPDFIPDESSAVSIEMKAGQSVIFWSTLMHASYPNSTTDKTRMAVTARYVPTSCKVYPGTATVEEYGSVLSLDKYGVIVVSGEDQFGHNKVIKENLQGVPFKHAAQA